MTSYGEQAVGLDFNPSGDETVHKLKALFAEIIDICNEERLTARGEKARLYSVAVTQTQDAQMWAVKARTWKDDPESL